ncbi:uncharacterized protein LOC135839948 isoform X2 [Planococcus citri]|uniref:uncharacterized protein LOC135839948 isoform X2 n=1 Tax=Planococcus citri TaxID=170843 RepID=UPI0031F765BE
MSETTDQDSEITDVRSIEGFDMLNKSKQEEIEAKFREQKKMKDLHIDDYNPWGKPGHGAPNEDTLRKRKIFMDVLPPVVLKAVGNDATMMGRPGGGAPVRTKSGKLKNARVEDPQLRFQWHGPVRKMVDIDLRYRVPVADQKAYKEELDQLVKEKKVIERETACHDDIKDHQMGSDANTFRRLGSHPQDNKDLYEKFPHIDEAIRLEQITGGIELEPLLAIRRRKAKRYPLGTSDVTGIMDIKPNISITDKEYSEALEQQITAREHHKQEEKEEDQMTARKHFENWDTFWGRPGHGAPKPVKVKENLEYILYQLPILIKKEGMGHEDEEHDQESEKSEN